MNYHKPNFYYNIINQSVFLVPPFKIVPRADVFRTSKKEKKKERHRSQFVSMALSLTMSDVRNKVKEKGRKEKRSEGGREREREKQFHTTMSSEYARTKKVKK